MCCFLDFYNSVYVIFRLYLNTAMNFLFYKIFGKILSNFSSDIFSGRARVNGIYELLLSWLERQWISHHCDIKLRRLSLTFRLFMGRPSTNTWAVAPS
jgi:hypothetical protein